jgi:hypothetical protein
MMLRREVKKAKGVSSDVPNASLQRIRVSARVLGPTLAVDRGHSVLMIDIIQSVLQHNLRHRHWGESASGPTAIEFLVLIRL